jgi:arylsulfatase A-like enzyme
MKRAPVGRGGPEAPRETGGAQFALAWRLAAVALLGCVLLQLLLYVRPGPYGGPFLLEWRRYFGLALYYEMLGVWLLSLPFFLLWLALYRRPVGPRWASAIHAVQIALLIANLALSQVDHEVLRFLGVRLGFSFLMTYAGTETLSDSLFLDVLLADQGGPLLALLLLFAIPGAYAWWSLRRLRHGRPRAAPLWLALAIALVPLAAPANAWLKATGQFRLRKVEPVVLALYTDLRLGFADARKPADLARLASAYQRRWLAESGDGGWRFPDPQRPYLRVPVGPPRAPERKWNILYLQLETLRGADTGFLRPELKPSPTPHLDRLARVPGAAVWTRALSFGMPSINGLFATHCSVSPHSRRYVTAFTRTELLCLPDLLRRHGYRAEMFNGGDSDWDNSTLWLERWYDRLWRYPEARESDRAVFRAALPRIRALGRSGRPFLASLVSVSNHTPFRSKEPALDIAGQGSPRERILNTTHYTDDVVREFLEALAAEPWFERTLVVITGDHGFNLGEHGGAWGTHSLYRESVWVPLLILGPHPRLPAGRHGGLATLLDVAPTLADLLGLREANPWQGHSLAGPARARGLAFGLRETLLAETPDWTATTDPGDNRPRLFDARRDWLQRNDRAARHPRLTDALLRRARDAQRLNDYLLRHDRIWRSPPD